MKKILLITALILASYAGFSQIGYGYTYIAQRYNWLAGVFSKGFGVPAGDGAVFYSGQYQGAGALYYDSTGVDSGLYVWSGLAWRNISTGGGTPFTLYGNLPLYVIGDTMYIDPATSASDGYATAAQIAKLDTLQNNWVRVNSSRLYTANTTDSVIIGVPVAALHKWNLIGNGHFTGVLYTSTANRRALEINSATQNAFGGGRSGNDAASGHVENAAWGELSLGSITDGDYNSALGKGAGFTCTTCIGNIFIGRNVHASGGTYTGNNGVAIGANLPSLTASNQLNINNWIYGNDGRLGIGATAALTPTATFTIDSAVDYAHLRLIAMAADPTVVNNGNIWHYNNHLWARLNGATYQLDQQTAATPGIDAVIAADGTLTTNRTINAGANTLTVGGSATAFSLLGTGSGPVGFAQIQPASTNTMLPVMTFRRSTTGTAAAGIGGRLDLELLNGSGSAITANSIKWRLTTVTAGAEVSEFIVNGLGAGADRNFLTVQTDGTATVNNGVDTLETRAGARSRAETVTNKRNVRRVTTITSSATPTPDGDASDIFTVSALAAGATFAAPTGTPQEGQGLIIRIKDNGGAQTLAWNAIYRAGTDIALPTTTVAGKFIYVGFLYNSASSTWDIVSKIDGF